MSLGLVINPGTGSIPGATEENAIANMSQFMQDCDVKDMRYTRSAERDDSEGRFGFDLYREGDPLVVKVQMPGLPLERVRYMGETGNPWNFPRLYVDGSSWLWEFAIEIVRDHIS